MRVTKFLVFLAGLLGAISFFLPLAKGQVRSYHFHLSPYRMVKGIDDAAQVMEGIETDASARERMNDNLAQLQSTVERFRFLMLKMYAPMAVLLMVGFMGVAGGTFGRIAGTLSLLSGVAGLSMALMYDIGDQSGFNMAGAGLYFMYAGSALGSIFGLCGLIWPEREKFQLPRARTSSPPAD